MHDAYIGGCFRQTKITRKASDAAENLQLYRVVRFFHPRSCTTTHISADVQRITLNASCMTISGGRTKQLDIFCRVTGFTSDFLSFIVVELIRFFHGALQLRVLKHCPWRWCSGSPIRNLPRSLHAKFCNSWSNGTNTHRVFTQKQTPWRSISKGHRRLS